MPDLPIIEIVPDRRHSVFVCQLAKPISYDFAQRVQRAWKEVWEKSGVEKPPGLLILDPELQLRALSDTELREAGVVRLDPPMQHRDELA